MAPMGNTMTRTTAATACLALCADLALKWAPLGEARALVPGVLGLTSARNAGVAFGLLSASPAMSTAVTALALVLAAAWLARRPMRGLPALGAGLMLGGAMGNLADRLLHGSVGDYLQFLFMAFPVFNLADACLTLGAGVLMVSLLGKEDALGAD